MKSNNTILRELMDEHELKRSDVAKILKVSASTVDRWMAPAIVKGKRNRTHRRISDGQLAHLRLALGAVVTVDNTAEVE